MTQYPKGTLVKIEKLSAPSGPVDISKENMYGYVTDWWTAPVSGSSYYVVCTFPNSKKLNLPEHYLSAVTGQDKRYLESLQYDTPIDIQWVVHSTLDSEEQVW